MIALGSDHGGYDLKERVKAYLDKEGIAYEDYACCGRESCDYPVFSRRQGGGLSECHKASSSAPPASASPPWPTK